MTKRLLKWFIHLKIWTDEHGQDMVEYALLAGFVTVTVGAGYPPVSQDISEIFSKLHSITDQAP